MCGFTVFTFQAGAYLSWFSGKLFFYAKLINEKRQAMNSPPLFY